jgi:hypothetical protein
VNLEGEYADGLRPVGGAFFLRRAGAREVRAVRPAQQVVEALVVAQAVELRLGRQPDEPQVAAPERLVELGEGFVARAERGVAHGEVVVVDVALGGEGFELARDLARLFAAVRGDERVGELVGGYPRVGHELVAALQVGERLRLAPEFEQDVAALDVALPELRVEVDDLVGPGE